CIGAGALFATSDCPATETVRPTIGNLQADTGGAFSPECYRLEKAEPTSCSFGSPAKDAIRVALIGDSHAGMYMSVLRTVAQQLNWHVTTYVGWGCAW